jgi:hypothetical protein
MADVLAVTQLGVEISPVFPIDIDISNNTLRKPRLLKNMSKV